MNLTNINKKFIDYTHTHIYISQKKFDLDIIYDLIISFKS